MKIHGVMLLAALLCVSSAHGQEDDAEKARVALSYIDCDGDITVRNGRIGIMLSGRFVADTILGATYVGPIFVWGGQDKRYVLLFADDFSKVTMIATNGHGTIEAKCHRIQD
jgi:hypothetical protein